MAPFIVTIVGPTASGKTALAIRAAEEIGGEVICADSRTVYRGLDIGTAKPTALEQQAIPHHLIDIVEPDQTFTAADFQRLAEAKISSITSRHHVPFVVGGTGLYVDGLLYGYRFGQVADQLLRSRLQAMTLDELHEYCKNNNVKLPQNHLNKRYVVRAVEQNGINQQRSRTKKFNGPMIGLHVQRDELRRRIEERADIIFSSSVVDETAKAARRYGWGSEAMTGNIYPLLREYLEGRDSLRSVKERFITADMRLAKRQMTWFRRNPDITWFDRQEAAYHFIVQSAGKHIGR